MLEKTALKLTQLFDMGYAIHIENGPYVTGLVSSIGREDYDDEADDNSPFVYSDEMMEDHPLSQVQVEQVKVYAPVNWLDPLFQPEEQDIDDNFFTNEDEVKPFKL